MSTQIYVRSALRRRLPQLSDDQLTDLEAIVLEELKRRLRQQLISTFSNEEIGETSAYFDNDDEKLRQWLVNNHPGHFAVIHEETVKLLDEVVFNVNGATQGESTAPQSDLDDETDEDWDAKEASFDSPFMNAQLPDWKALRQFLGTGFEGTKGERILSLDVELPSGSVQPVIVRNFNSAFAEVSAGLGLGLSVGQHTAILRSLKRFVGLGAALDGEVLLARHALPYYGLTSGSAFQTVILVAGAVNEIIREFNAENEQ